MVWSLLLPLLEIPSHPHHLQASREREVQTQKTTPPPPPRRQYHQGKNVQEHKRESSSSFSFLAAFSCACESFNLPPPLPGPACVFCLVLIVCIS